MSDDSTDRLADESDELEYPATQVLSPDDSGDEHAATVRLGDGDDDGDGDDEAPAKLPKPPSLSKLKKSSPEKLKAMLEKSRQLKSRPTLPDVAETTSETVPSLDALESDADATDEVEVVIGEADAETHTRPDMAIAELTSVDASTTDTRADVEAMAEPSDVVALDVASEDPTGKLQWPPEGEDSEPSLDAPRASGPLIAPPAAYAIQEPLVPSGEYGVLPGIGENSRSGEHAAPRPINRDPRRVVMAMAAVGCFAVAISAALVVQNWLAQERAMIWIGSAALASTLLMGLIAPWEHEGGSKHGFMVRVLPGLMFTCIALMLSSIWSIGAVRAFAVSAAPDDVLSMERILDDPSDEVAAAGCERYMAHHGDPTWWGRMLTIIAARPAVAATCLHDVPTELQATVAGSLIDRWGRELLADEELPKNRACAMAVGFTQLPVEPAVMSAPLLDCTLSSRHETTQACCGEALASTVSEPKQWALRVSAAAGRLKGENTPSGVFSMAFQPDALTPAQKKFADAVKFDGVMGRGAALALVCETMSEDQDKVIRHLRAVLDGECDLDVGKLPTKLAVWDPICEATKIEVEADRTRPPVDTLCQITRETVVPEAIDTARRLTTLARVRQNEGIAEGVHAGYNQLIASFGGSGELATSPMALSAEDRHAAMLAASKGSGTVVFIKGKEQRKFERNLDPQSRKELHAWEKRRAERMKR